MSNKQHTMHLNVVDLLIPKLKELDPTTVQDINMESYILWGCLENTVSEEELINVMSDPEHVNKYLALAKSRILLEM